MSTTNDPAAGTGGDTTHETPISCPKCGLPRMGDVDLDGSICPDHPLPETPTKYRRHNWLNTETMTVQHGIQAKSQRGWMHCAEDGKPLLFDTEAGRDTKLKELRKTAKEERK